MPELLAAIEAFVQGHRRCGELDGGVDREWSGWRATAAPGWYALPGTDLW